MSIEFLQNWAVVALVVVLSFGLGALIDFIALRAVRAAAQRTGSRALRAVALALPGQPEIWTVIAGLAIFEPLDFLGANARLWTNRVVIAALVLSITLFLSRFAVWMIRDHQARTGKAAGTIFVNLARITIWAVGLTVLLGSLGVQIGPLIASLGIAGLALSLGLQDTLSNFFSGLQISTSPQFEKGHFIRLTSTGDEGWIEDVTWRDTTIKTFSNDLVVVPNAVLANEIIQNFTGETQDHVVWVRVGVAYDSDLDRVETVTLETMRQLYIDSDMVKKDEEPAMRFLEFGDSAVTLQARIVASRYEDRFVLLSEGIKRLHRAYRDAGIEIPFPQTTVHLANSSPEET